jgi:hypothetical protein
VSSEIENRLRRAVEVDGARTAAGRASKPCAVPSSDLRRHADALRIRFFRESQKIVDSAVAVINAALRPRGYRLILVSSGEGEDEEIVVEVVYKLGRPSPFGIELHLALLNDGTFVGLIPTSNPERPARLGRPIHITDFDVNACKELLALFVEKGLGVPDRSR